MTEPILTLNHLLAGMLSGFPGNESWKVVRHQENRHGGVNLVDLVYLERTAFETYQSWQATDVFGKCDGILSFVALSGTEALFVGAYSVRSLGIGPHPSTDDAPSAVLRPLWKDLGGQQSWHYELLPDPRFARLERRLVIDWGKGARAWHQWKLDKAVVGLRDPNALESCPALADVDVTIGKVAMLAAHEEANTSWRDRLGSVGGIYLLTDHANDKLYVGQAGGSGGFWGRWKEYAALKSGNVAVDPALLDGTIDLERASFSVLEVVPLGAGAKERMNESEARWKRRLRSRVVGWNRN